MDISVDPDITQSEALLVKLVHHLEFIYAEVELDEPLEQIARRLLQKMRLDQSFDVPQPHQNNWSQQDAVLITYGNTFLHGDEKPLKTLYNFLQNHVQGVFNGVHILPFFPYSSDDGFAVINFSSVNEALGDWSDIRKIASDYRLMADLVINHCSSRSMWFENFKNGVSPGVDYFLTVPPDTDTSMVTRPRTSELLCQTRTVNGDQYVWCTFGHDQIDLNFRNPAVLEEFVGIIRHYLDNGVSIFRLDAVAFLWKKPGTTCLNLLETHEIIRLLRTLIERAAPQAIIITETNIPNQENLSYFGNANEAHAIYNFSLPPLLLNTLVTGDCSYLKQWLMSMPPSQQGTTYLNFIASHDGIGLRPAEGLLSEQEINDLVATMGQFGGQISWRAEQGFNKPYEINISLIDAMQGTREGPDEFGIDRFICAHAIMFALEGIPAVYIHSLLGTHNDRERVELYGHNRAINRHQWDYSELEKHLASHDNSHARIMARMKSLLSLRKQQPAFHPNATQFTLHLGEQIFGFWRQSIDRRQSIFCIYNISNQVQSLFISDLNLIITEKWRDLISGADINYLQESIELQPYQAIWLSNHFGLQS